MTTGVKENRQEASKEYVRAREEAAKEAAEKVEETTSEVQTGEFYDENGRLVKRVRYWLAQKSYLIDTYVDGVRRRSEYYNEGGSLRQVLEFDARGWSEKIKTYTESEINVRLFGRQLWNQIYDLNEIFQYQYKTSIIDNRWVVDYSVKYDADGNVME